MGVVAIAMATTLILPDRMTEKILRAGGDVGIGALRQAMGQAR